VKTVSAEIEADGSNDEQVELADHVAAKVLFSEPLEMSSEDLAELEAAVAESTEQLERGEFEDAGVLAVRLAARL
jgi:hypothetical protein